MAFNLRQTLIFGTLEILVTKPFFSLEMARFEPSGLPWSEYQAIALPTELFCLDLRKCATNTKVPLKRKIKMANYWKLDLAALLGIPAEVVFWFELGSFWFGFGQNWFWVVLAVSGWWVVGEWVGGWLVGVCLCVRVYCSIFWGGCMFFQPHLRSLELALSSMCGELTL